MVLRPARRGDGRPRRLCRRAAPHSRRGSSGCGATTSVSTPPNYAASGASCSSVNPCPTRSAQSAASTRRSTSHEGSTPHPGSSGRRRAAPECGCSTTGSTTPESLLEPVLDWFTEGYDTADLRDAREPPRSSSHRASALSARPSPSASTEPHVPAAVAVGVDPGRPRRRTPGRRGRRRRCRASRSAASPSPSRSTSAPPPGCSTPSSPNQRSPAAAVRADRPGARAVVGEVGLRRPSPSTSSTA